MNNIVKLFTERKMTVYEIAEALKISKEEVFAILAAENQTLPPRDKKYRLIRSTPLSQEQKEFIVGSLIGSGHLFKHDEGHRYTAGHLNEEVDVLLWKKTILGNLSNVIIANTKKPAQFFRTSIHNELNRYAKMFYLNNKKIIPKDVANYITPLSLAAIVSDLGWVNKVFNIRLQTVRYSYEEHLLLKAVFKLFKINVKIVEFGQPDNKKYFLSFNKRNSLLFYELIKDVYPFPIRDKSPSTSQRLYT